MKITLTKDHSIRGVIEPADTVVDVHEGVAKDLIARGIAKTSIDRGIVKKPAKKAGK